VLQSAAGDPTRRFNLRFGGASTIGDCAEKQSMLGIVRDALEPEDERMWRSLKPEINETCAEVDDTRCQPARRNADRGDRRQRMVRGLHSANDLAYGRHADR
jgi:hypothetical protein